MNSVDVAHVRGLDPTSIVKPSATRRAHVAICAQQMILLASPDHGDGSRETATHVECEEFFRVLDLPRAGLLCELLIRFKNLANTSRPNGVTVGD